MNNTPLPPCPEGRGPDVLAWLRSAGLIERTPAPIRPSEAEDYYTDPFLYLLRHRFGIQTPWSGGDALELGSCFHHHMEALVTRGSLAAFDEPRATLIEELRTQMLDEAVIESSVATLLDSFTKAGHWAQCAWALRPIPPRYRILATELLLQINVESLDGDRTTAICRLDALAYDDSRKELWIVDYKTCTQSPSQRMSTAPWEIQTRLNRLITSECLPTIRRMWGLPPDCKLAGFMHYLVQKPQFMVLKKPSTWAAAGYEGYGTRCRDWYAGDGEFKSLAPQWANDPPVVLSFVRFEGPALDDEFHIRLHPVMVAACSDPVPYRYPRSSSFIRDGWSNNLHPLHPFFADDSFHMWPDLLASGRFRQRFRDWPLPPVRIPPPPFNKGFIDVLDPTAVSDPLVPSADHPRQLAS